MERSVVLLDTGILIEFFRKKEKEKSILYQLSLDSYEFRVSTITQYEILLGANESQIEFWNSFFERIQSLSFDKNSAIAASEIYKQLKAKNELIDMADILIGAIAMSNHISLATLNRKHFSRIKGLELLSISNS